MHIFFVANFFVSIFATFSFFLRVFILSTCTVCFFLSLTIRKQPKTPHSQAQSFFYSSVMLTMWMGIPNKFHCFLLSLFIVFYSSHWGDEATVKFFGVILSEFSHLGCRASANEKIWSIHKKNTHTHTHTLQMTHGPWVMDNSRKNVYFKCWNKTKNWVNQEIRGGGWWGVKQHENVTSISTLWTE